MITLWTRFGAAADDSFGSSDPGQALLNAHFHRQSGDALTLAIRSSGDISSAAARPQVTRALDPVTGRRPRVTSVTGPYAAPGQISRDGHIAFATIQFGVPSTKISGTEVQALMKDATAASGRGLTFSLGGDVVDLAETPYGGPTEGIGTVAAAIVLLIAFGSLLAMGLPIVTAPVRHRHRAVADRAARARLPGTVVLADRGRHDRTGRGRRLRAVHRDQIP